jgi:hypothetical protein
MRYEYRIEADASKKFSAKQMAGTPKDLELDFDNVHVRVYKSDEQTGYFRCTLAVPAHEDDEGYVREFDFSDPIKARELENPREEIIPPFESDFDSGEASYWDYYEAPFNDHDFDTLVQAMSAKLSEKTEQGRKFLIFHLKISGTPFNGCTTIYPDLYREKA